MKKRLTSWVFWSSVAAQVLSLLTATGVLPLSKSDAVNAAVAALLQLFVCFGVLNNPTDKENF
ncbi:MAG: hypothetical protein IKZ81_07275 [Clostridia bacterium]|nr:hypothetical protein [Clostridia bacterium]